MHDMINQVAMCMSDEIVIFVIFRMQVAAHLGILVSFISFKELVVVVDFHILNGCMVTLRETKSYPLGFEG